MWYSREKCDCPHCVSESALPPICSHFPRSACKSENFVKTVHAELIMPPTPVIAVDYRWNGVRWGGDTRNSYVLVHAKYYY